MTGYGLSAAVMTAAGVGIPLLAALNAALGARLGSVTGAAVVLFCVALAVALAVFAAGGGTLRGLSSAPRHLGLGGLLVAFYVLSITAVAPRFGVGNAIFFVLLGQLASAAVIDHLGLFGARLVPMTPTRALGLVVMGAGVFLTQIAGRS